MKIAIVTGASSGLGKKFAIYSQLFFKDIEEIWIIGRNYKNLLKTAKYINANVRIFTTDITNEEDMEVIKQTLKEEKPEIELLINCAGVGYMGSFSRISEDDNVKMIDVNCKALTVMNYICIPYMIKGGRIINVASAAAFIAQSNFAVYSATKSYVLSLSDSLGKELRKQQIYVLAVCPGSVNTPFFDEAEKYENRKWFKKYVMAQSKNVVLKALWDSKKHKTRSIYGLFIILFYLACKLLPHKLMMKFV